MIRLEVRSCCQPQKLLGWLEAPDDAHVGMVRLFPVYPLGRIVGNGESLYLDIVTLPIAAFYSPAEGERLAYKSEETPLEQLRLIPGFIEAPECST